MADNDMLFRQCAVIEFLVKEEIPAAEIHQRLQRIYGSVCMGASSVRRWVKHFKDWKTSIQDVPCEMWKQRLPPNLLLISNIATVRRHTRQLH